MVEDLFSQYAIIVRKADILFKTIHEKYPDSVRCRIRCCDCCHAVFGLFPIEAAYIHHQLNRIDRKIRRDVQRRAEKSEVEMLKAADKLKEAFNDNPKMQAYGLGKQRVKCPLLNEREECILYENRPVICRIYGVPFSIKHEKKENAYVCGISGFEAKASYPTVKLDNIYQELVGLSIEMLKEAGFLNPAAKANLMLPLSKILRMSFDDIVKGNFGE